MIQEEQDRVLLDNASGATGESTLPPTLEGDLDFLRSHRDASGNKTAHFRTAQLQVILEGHTSLSSIAKALTTLTLTLILTVPLADSEHIPKQNDLRYAQSSRRGG